MTQHLCDSQTLITWSKISRVPQKVSFRQRSTTISTLAQCPSLRLLGDNYIIRSGWVLHHCCLIPMTLYFSSHPLTFWSLRDKIFFALMLLFCCIFAIIIMVLTSIGLHNASVFTHFLHAEFFPCLSILLVCCWWFPNTCDQRPLFFLSFLGMLEYDPAKRFSIQNIRQHK